MAVKAKRPVAMATPPPQARSKSAFTEEEKRGVLENFDLEVADKTAQFHASLNATLVSFELRANSEMLRIPREMRRLTLGELEKNWGGSLQGTLQRIIGERIAMEEREREREREERERAEVEAGAKGKRKRAAATPSSSPSRNTKNARKDPESSRKIPSSAIKRKGGKKTASTPSSTSKKGPSGLPQNHVFNPHLPSTPLIPRPARQGEVFLSANGSPLTFNPPTASTASLAKSLLGPNAPSLPSAGPSRPAVTTRGPSGIDLSSDSPSESESLPAGNDDDDDYDDDDLPDPEALEAQFLAASASQPNSKPSRKKRAPSLMFARPLGAGAGATPQKPLPPRPSFSADGIPLSTITLSDGREMSFNPMAVTPKRIQQELDEGGFSEADKAAVGKKIQAEVLKALERGFERWKM